MSAFALRACVLIRLQARKGEWVPLQDLVAHLGVSIERVRNVVQQLVDAGHAHQAVVESRELVGIGVEGVQP